MTQTLQPTAAVKAAPLIMTAEEFAVYALLPENADKRLEWHHGKVVELVSSMQPSKISLRMMSVVESFVYDHDLGYTTTTDGGYIVNGAQYIPDGAYVSYTRDPGTANHAYNPITPDLAIEVISPSDRPGDVSGKIVDYMLAGTVVWLVDPEEETVDVFVPGQPHVRLTVDDTLDGGTTLPGFSLPLKRIFRRAASSAADSAD
jgi:Uma2 family endonuclease